jgi:deoxyribonuclease V
MTADKGKKDLWPKTLQDARALQELLRKRVKIVPLRKPPHYIAGVDAAFIDDIVVAVASLFTCPSMQYREDAVFREKTKFPYIPGYLTFREGHAIVNAVKRLKTSPDVILVDGQGIAHPRGIGIASHIGILLGIPTIGCAKSRLVGEFQELGREKGDWVCLSYHGLRVGAVLRTRREVKPVFVSPGHMTDIPSSVKIVMECVSHFRIPEPLRRADLISKRLAKLEQGLEWTVALHRQ